MHLVVSKDAVGLSSRWVAAVVAGTTIVAFGASWWRWGPLTALFLEAVAFALVVFAALLLASARGRSRRGAPAPEE